MRAIHVYLLIFALTVYGCQSTNIETSSPVVHALESPTMESATIPAPSETPSPTETATAPPTTPPAGLIRVDTLEQEVYPFVENGKCSLAEAIFAANSGETKDSCAAGVVGETVIDLMPGEYHFTQREQLLRKWNG